jgi:hypothetical protein
MSRRRAAPIAGPGILAALTVALVATSPLAGCGGGGDGSRNRGPDPQPAFYLTASNPADLKRQAYSAGARFARSQREDESLLVLDFGAARLHKGEYGAALRNGTFFSNRAIGAALQTAARGYEDHHHRGGVTIVYANSNALLSRPGPGYVAFTEEIAREAGEQQARAVEGLDLTPRQSVALGGDIEPGYDIVGRPEVSIALVGGANSASQKPYYDVGTAPCSGRRCTNGWTPRDICEVASGQGRAVLPEIYYEQVIDQPAQWAAIQKRCEIHTFAGVSASPVGSFSPNGSWQKLRGNTPAGVNRVIVVWPG